MEELLESEVMWPDQNMNTDTVGYNNTKSASRGNHHARATKSNNFIIPSTPIAIPGSSSSSSSSSTVNMFKEECYNDINRVQEPPHVLVSRRRNAGINLAFPLCSGQGRTLKGRDLREVRGAVWRMTGFIDG